MEGINIVMLAGDAVSSPTISRSGLNGVTKISFSLAVSRWAKESKLVEVITVISYDKVADSVKRQLRKNSRVFVEGRLQVTVRDGHTSYAVLANKITFLTNQL